MSALSQRALEIAKSRIGTKESPIGSNWGHPVQDWLARVDIHEPAPWCYAFVYCCFDDAAKELGIPNPLPKTGRVLTAWAKAGADHQVHTPQPGDIFIMDLGGGLGHCGIDEIIHADGLTLSTIDGNTNDNASREGFEVEEKTRHNQKPVIGHLRF